MAKILLGYEVGTGKMVHLPLHHTGFTGMTQKAGKTTAIEAASMRSGMRAITFRTKRGEIGFETTGTEIKPYFLEKSDWQYVESLIEATLRENQRFNRSWIIRACEGTKDDLNKVWENIKIAKKKARGLALSVYTNLDAYFKIVLPEIRRYDFSKKLDIAESGVSVMNLIGIPTEVQALVIRSVIDQIYEHERNIIVVIPEAWKFIGITHTPVTYVAERLIREGASVGIYLFLDSQDISGINTRIRSQIDNWILGRQKYEHEIERTLKAIPVKNKPTKEQIQTLKLGHFYAACDIWVRKIYFLPWQIPEEIGIEVAMGQKKPEYVKKILDERREKFRKEGDEMVWKEKFKEKEQEFNNLKREFSKLSHTVGTLEKEKISLQTKVKELEKNIPSKIEVENLKKRLERKGEELIKAQRKLMDFQWFEDMIKGIVKDVVPQAEVRAGKISEAEIIPVVDQRLQQLIGEKKKIEVVTVDTSSKIRELVENEATKPIITTFQGLSDILKKATRFIFQMKEASVGQLNEYLYQRSGRPSGAFYNNIVKPMQNIGVISLKDGTLTWTLNATLTSRLPFMKNDEIQKLHDYLVSLLL